MRRSPGSTLAIVVAFLAAFLIIATGLSVLIEKRLKLTRYNASRALALGVAEAGLDDALNILSDTPSWTAGFSNKVFEGGFYTVTIDTSTGRTRVISDGYLPAGSFIGAAVHRKVSVYLSGFDKVCSSISKDMEIDKSTCDGNVYSGKDMDLKSGSLVTGDAEAQRDITLSGGSAVSGTKNAQNYPPVLPAIPFPSLQTDAHYLTEAQAGGTYVGDYTIDGATVTLGPLYITGELKIKNGAKVTLTGPVYVKKEVTIDESELKGKYTLFAEKEMDIEKSTIGLGNLGPLLISKKDSTLDESTAYRTIYYVYNEKLTLQKSTLTGMVIGKELDVKDNSAVTWMEITDLDVALTGSAPEDWSSN
ncbi:hypothetical protein HY522_08500 [bacterium]|nr:hypothetical protein [bacterium]